MKSYARLKVQLHHENLPVMSERDPKENRTRTIKHEGRTDDIPAPILKLPPEIMCIIFALVVFPIHDPWKSRSLMNIVSVCSKWRLTAFAASSFWNQIYFDFDRLSSNWTSGQTCDYLDAWRGRAQSRSLCVYFRGDMENRLGTRTAAALMQRFAPRVRDLQLELPFGRWKSHCFNSDVFKWTVLERLAIWSPESDFAALGDTFAVAPQLRDLHLSHHPLPWTSRFWKHLVRFSGGITSLQSCIEFLHKSESLLECTLFFDYTHSQLPANVSSVLHPSLCVLRLICLHEPTMDLVYALLYIMTLPALHTFALEKVPADDCLIEFLSRHYLHLSSLSVDCASVEALIPLSALTRLTVTSVDWVFAAEFIQWFEDPHERFLPALQYLTFGDFSPEDPAAEYEALARALCCRWQRHQDNGSDDVAALRLFHLEVQLDDTDELRFEDDIRPLTDSNLDGLEIRVERFPDPTISILS
ncbi:hypothetical protein R3P38DRAFT_2853919 [Favolaschia claudopus]|uniref:F-box domain-containing protein n=1 Tax=Favolaschia claudopus TaxID=2862362 RepID=A0AAW0DR29_9AGAR